MKLFATVLFAAALAVGPSAAGSAATAAPATAVVPSASGGYGTLVEKPLEGFFPSAAICDAERLSFKSQGYWTSGCFYSTTNRGWAFYRD